MNYEDIFFNKENEEKARELVKKRTTEFGDRYNSQERWIGHLAEPVFDYYYPDFTQPDKDPIRHFDRVHPITKEKVEIKSGGGKDEWKEGFSIAMDHDQWQENPYKLIVYCYYHLADNYPRRMILAGWNEREVFEQHSSKRFYPKGDISMTQSGHPMFKVQNKNGCYVWASNVLLNMNSIKSRN